MVLFPPWEIHSGRVSLAGCPKVLDVQKLKVSGLIHSVTTNPLNSWTRQWNMMTICVRGCLLGNDRGEAPICHEFLPKIRFSTISPTPASTAITRVCRCLLLLCRLSHSKGVHKLLTDPPNILFSMTTLPECIFSGRHRVPSLAQVECSTTTKQRNYNLQSSATSLMFTQRWN